MTTMCKCQRVLIAAFEEAALALGGVVASYRIPDEAVWDLARALDLACERARTSMGRGGAEAPAEADDPEDREHPAIVHLLGRLQQHQAGVGVCAGHQKVQL